MDTPVVVVGAGPAGLATAACLARAGVEHVLLEQAAELGASWRRHYDRLHLHTPKGISALPYVPYPRAAPRYPSRDDVIAYLEGYAGVLGLRPRLGEAVTAIAAAPDGEDPAWTVDTSQTRYRAKHVVVATGLARVPVLPAWPGREGYRGQVLHSSRYVNGAAWRGGRVLVVGIGNSGGEIAVDLLEQGATPALSVRGAVNVIPREVLGIPILSVGALLRVLPPALGDLLGRPLIRLGVGDVEALGLRRLPYGALTQVDRHGRVPLIDAGKTGTIAQIRAGRIALRPGIERFTADGVRFTDGREEPFDAVVAATGYGPGLGETLGALSGLRPAPNGPAAALTPRPGLHLCGFRISTRGMLNQIRHDARAIARTIVRAQQR
ncbi:MAG TPA: NAD(P)/FAD-dependent oxidoreductase [Polyangia bacterium]|nr:NAD(P)/FAD-dependent oxidoreductase [Polyangia bacterium]